MEKDYHERWEIIQELGKGGQGVVYEVLDRSQFNFQIINANLNLLRTPSERSEIFPAKQLHGFSPE